MEQVYESMCRTYPREMYDLDPEKFWEFFQREIPNVSRVWMGRWIDQVPYYADVA